MSIIQPTLLLLPSLFPQCLLLPSSPSPPSLPQSLSHTTLPLFLHAFLQPFVPKPPSHIFHSSHPTINTVHTSPGAGPVACSPSYILYTLQLLSPSIHIHAILVLLLPLFPCSLLEWQYCFLISFASLSLQQVHSTMPGQGHPMWEEDKYSSAFLRACV